MDKSASGLYLNLGLFSISLILLSSPFLREIFIPYSSNPIWDVVSWWTIVLVCIISFVGSISYVFETFGNSQREPQNLMLGRRALVLEKQSRHPGLRVGPNFPDFALVGERVTIGEKPKPNGDEASMAQTPKKKSLLEPPETGSPSVNSAVTYRLPTWMHKMDGFLEKNAQKRFEVSTQRPATKVLFEKSRQKGPRIFVDPDMALREMNLTIYLGTCLENVEQWFLNNIIRPLWNDIQLVTRAFEANGLDHLCPSFPAATGLVTSSNFFGSPKLPNETIFLSRSREESLSTRPQSLLELAKQMPQDQTVKKRLRIERFFSFAASSTQRRHILTIISRICEVPAANAKSIYSEEELPFFHLFNTFMDENMPSDNFLEAQPFTSRHFVPENCSPSDKDGVLQIQQVSSRNFRLITDSKIYDTFPGVASFFVTTIYLVEFCHRFYKGYLGVANLASPNIDLISILS